LHPFNPVNPVKYLNLELKNSGKSVFVNSVLFAAHFRILLPASVLVFFALFAVNILNSEFCLLNYVFCPGYSLKKAQKSQKMAKNGLKTLKNVKKRPKTANNARRAAKTQGRLTVMGLEMIKPVQLQYQSAFIKSGRSRKFFYRLEWVGDA